MSANKTVAEQHAIIGNVSGADISIERNTHPGAEWFFKPVQLGLFIHYGISTVHGDLDISWGMMENPVRRKKGNGIVTPREYWALAEKFNAERYDPMEWLSAAKSAGFTYAVLTTKHHDGYCLWPTDTTDFSTKTYMN
jgi:alpha-L-fucosidase